MLHFSPLRLVLPNVYGLHQCEGLGGKFRPLLYPWLLLFPLRGLFASQESQGGVRNWGKKSKAQLILCLLFRLRLFLNDFLSESYFLIGNSSWWWSTNIKSFHLFYEIGSDFTSNKLFQSQAASWTELDWISNKQTD